ncbi:TRAP transporter substrate-binding protein [Hominifimenecus sp. rT4P-3]|uniref:TRAP transporter substrate-binding protein n=1 Tax=Hominifimenecus sp. rT4P-3 TaxID=3242979 RepID=UPI003DA26C87
MKNGKRMMAALLAAMMALSAVGCGGDSETTAAAKTTAPAESATAAADTTAAATDGSETASQSQGQSAGTMDLAKAAKGELTAAELGVEVTSTDSVKLVWAHNGSSQSASSKGYAYLEKLIEEGSNGNIQVEVYPDSTLGTATEINQNLKANTIQIGCGNVGGLVDDTLAYFDMNGAMTSREDALKLTASGTEVRQYTENAFNNLGFELLMLTPYGFRVTSSNKALNTFDDLSGLDIRITENNVQMAFWKACGANPTPLAFNDLYVSLQQGLVNAQENPYNTIVTNKFYEVQEYVTETNHQMFVAGIWMNKACYDGLPDDYKALIKAASAATEAYLYQTGVDEEETAKAALTDAGITLISWTEEDYAKVLEAGKSCWDLIRELAGDEPVELVMKSLGIQ